MYQLLTAWSLKDDFALVRKNIQNLLLRLPEYSSNGNGGNLQINADIQKWSWKREALYDGNKDMYRWTMMESYWIYVVGLRTGLNK